MKIIDLNTTTESELIRQAVETLAAGGIVIYPTETCYGVGVDATNPEAVKNVLQYKRRPEGKPISIAVVDREMASEYVEINQQAKSFYDKFLPGPYTVISKSRGKVEKALESERGTLGIRIPDQQLIRKIVKEFGKPITSTSANSAGKKTPYTIADIKENISNKQLELVDLIIDAGKLPQNPPSTVVDTTRADLQIIRAGANLPYTDEQQFTVNSALEMQQIGEDFIKQYLTDLENKCVVVLFNAQLGAGKTQFVKGLAKGMSITELVKSPTYTIMEEYEVGDYKLIHFDAWRLESMTEFEQLNVEQYIAPKNVIAIEWAGGTMEFFQQFFTDPQVIFVQIQINYIDLETRDMKILS